MMNATSNRPLFTKPIRRDLFKSPVFGVVQHITIYQHSCRAFTSIELLSNPTSDWDYLVHPGPGREFLSTFFSITLIKMGDPPSKWRKLDLLCGASISGVGDCRDMIYERSIGLATFSIFNVTPSSAYGVETWLHFVLHHHTFTSTLLRLYTCLFFTLSHFFPVPDL